MRRLSSRGLVAVLAAVASALVPASARADDDEALIRSGIQLRRQQHDVEALAVFQRAYSLVPTPRARAQIGLAEQSLGRWVASESDLRAALDTDDPWVGRNRESLEQALSFVSTHLGWLLVSSNVAASLVLDGAAIETLPMQHPARVAVGTVLVRVEAPGYAPAEKTVRVGAREPVLETVDLVAVSAPVTLTAPVETKSGDRPRPPQAPATLPPRPVPWVSLGLAGVGIVALGVGSVLGVEAFVDKAARDEHCVAGGCDARGLSFDTQARQAAMASTIALGAGAIALVAGAWLFLKAPPSSAAVARTKAASARPAGLYPLVVW